MLVITSPASDIITSYKKASKRDAPNFSFAEVMIVSLENDGPVAFVY